MLANRSRNMVDKVYSHIRHVHAWATVDPASMSERNPHDVQNLVNGSWTSTGKQINVIDPLNGEIFIRVPDTTNDEAGQFISSLKQVPKYGLHNNYHNPERYLMYGQISAKVAEQLRKDEVADFFARLIQRVAPKSYKQAMGEVTVTTRFFENFSGDQVRFLARGFQVAGDHSGQHTNGLRWPYGPVALIAPFNFPLEIVALQLAGSLYMGNKPCLHVDKKVCVVAEQFVRLMHHCGTPMTDIDMLNGHGDVMGHVVKEAQPRLTQFTGSSKVANMLSEVTKGKVALEHSGFDWKVLGPDVQHMDHVAWQCDQDAYACSGQKCSAQSLLIAHKNWINNGLINNIKDLASKRNMEDLTIGPVLTWSTDKLNKHIQDCLSIPGSKLLFGGKELTNHSIPKCYGAIEPTAIYMPLSSFFEQQFFKLATTEVFAPLQIVTDYADKDLDKVLELLSMIEEHLTAAIVSNDPIFLQKVLSTTVNGTTYVGIKARTTGAPQNHWFGPGGDPRGAGIGTPEAIRHVWSCHREIITDVGPVSTEKSFISS